MPTLTTRHFLAAGLLLAATSVAIAAPPPPLRLHPQNPRYLEFRGKPTLLITSAEHYGAVVNLDFDYVPYLDELARHRLNLTRVWSGAYVEDPKAFGIQDNTLAPKAGRFLAPWARSDQPGYANGGNRFDLTRWDPAFFQRLKDYVAQAGKRGIVIEMVLFCPMYEESMWALSPLNARNNVNGVGNVPRVEVFTLKHRGLQEIQEALVRKLVAELAPFDNVYYEIANEPYFGGITREWQHRIADVIADAEKALPAKHLIAQNIANGTQRIESPHPAVSIFNFHYAAPPDAVRDNWHLRKPIGDDETGFRGTSDQPYRIEGWDFLLAGGAIFDHLDYSFTTQHERGTYAIPPSQPGGGGVAFRKQMRVLRTFMEALPFTEMAPLDGALATTLPDGISGRVFAKEGSAYVLYLHVKAPKTTDYSARWTGFLEAPRAGTYTLHTVSNDGVRLWVDGKQVIDAWKDQAAEENTAKVALPAGKRIPVKMEFYQGGGGALARLLWTPPDATKANPIPVESLSTPDGKGRGLRGEYFADKALQQAGMTRVDPTVDFDWRQTSPWKSATAPGPQSPTVSLTLPAGRWRAEWIDTITGSVIAKEPFTHGGGAKSLASPPFTADVALRVLAAKAR